MPFISQLPGRLREPVFLAASFPSIFLALSTGQKIILFSETVQKNLPFNIDLYSLQLRVLRNPTVSSLGSDTVATCLLVHWLPVHPSLLCQLLVHRLSVHEFHVFAGSPFMGLPVASVARSPACCFLNDCLVSCCLFTICLFTGYLLPDVMTPLFVAVLFNCFKG